VRDQSSRHQSRSAYSGKCSPRIRFIPLTFGVVCGPTLVNLAPFPRVSAVYRHWDPIAWWSQRLADLCPSFLVLCRWKVPHFTLFQALFYFFLPICGLWEPLLSLVSSQKGSLLISRLVWLSCHLNYDMKYLLHGKIDISKHSWSHLESTLLSSGTLRGMISYSGRFTLGVIGVVRHFRLGTDKSTHTNSWIWGERPRKTDHGLLEQHTILHERDTLILEPYVLEGGRGCLVLTKDAPLWISGLNLVEVKSERSWRSLIYNFPSEIWHFKEGIIRFGSLNFLEVHLDLLNNNRKNFIKIDD